MKKYFTSINGEQKQNEVELTGNNKATVNGRMYEYEHKFLKGNILILRIENRNYSFSINKSEEENIFEVDLDSRVSKIICKSELDIILEGMSNGSTGSKLKKEIHSPMPGIIRSVNVKEGQSVSKGEVLLVLEAMKMENEIKAVKDCVIKKINIQPLSSVDKNELLIILE